MGLFDEIVCEYPLPDGWVPPPGTVFQTKDTEDQYLVRFTFGADGVLRRENGDDLKHHGAVNFYTSNWCGSASWGIMTSDDVPPWHADYTALFDHGKLLKIEGSREDDTTGVWIPKAEWHRLSCEADEKRRVAPSGEKRAER